MMTLSQAVLLIFWVFFFAMNVHAGTSSEGFSDWLKQLRKEAKHAGVSQETIHKTLGEIQEPNPQIIGLDQNQPEFKQPFTEYLSSRMTREKINYGRKMLRRYPTWLGRVEGTYGVQKRFLLALWGVESNYGKHLGSFPVVESLTSLAYDGRRADYFKRELFIVLKMVDAEIVPLSRMRGSWAGATGQCQFMPSAIQNFAVDADGDRVLDIWTSVPDVLASMANYLRRSGWRNDHTWGREVKLPQNFNSDLVGLKTSLPLPRWNALGVRRANGQNLPGRNIRASLIMPDGLNGQAFLVYDNFRVLLSWNRSTHFALTVGLLSDHFQ